MLVTMKDLLDDALAEGYAVGSFNISTLEMLDALLQTAAREQSPVIVSTSAAEARYLGPALVQKATRHLAETYGAICALHLDHGDSLAMAQKCIDAGYTSIMYDGSHHSLAENIETTCSVVNIARPHNITVEGEIGRISGKEDDIDVDESEAYLSDAAEAERFVKETGVDALAVAIGNAHGFYLEKPQLNFDRLTLIHTRTGLPIVLHGGTGLPADQIQQAIKLGIAKINVASKIRRAYLTALHDAIATDTASTDVMRVMQTGKDAMMAAWTTTIEMLGSAGRQAQLATRLKAQRR